ncbi:MAG: class IV adenylate cyclase [Acidobacteriia bacterium]|nr:class IV adenylate cyclase [Terriglobia bacterium]
MAHGAYETEIKLAVPDAKTARRILRAAGFRVSRPRVFESNIIFDTPGLALRQAATLLRVREAGPTATVTYKGPPVASRHKSREELEVAISRAAAMRGIFEHLGFGPVFRYEKFRTEFRRAGASGTAMLDETPVGVYLELEGTSRWIDRTARQLGFAESAYITSSYARLYLDWCERQHVTPSHMVFKAAPRRPVSAR